MQIYVDHAATTKPCSAAVAAMVRCLEQTYGNPSSLHSVGQAAAELLMNARQQIADCLGCSPREIFFTSGGSESDNQALISAARSGAAHGKRHIISTAIEHHAVLHTLEHLEQEGFSVTLLKPDAAGRISPEAVAAAIRPETCLVSVMLANNEIGTLEPVAEISAVCRERGVVLHTDAVQAVGQIPVSPKALGVDLLSLSGHKFHGPKGVGALYVRQGEPLHRLIYGGGQERGKRAGTENLPGIVGMAAALQESCAHMEERSAYVTELRNRLIAGLSQIPHSALNGSVEHRLPGNVHFCFEGAEGEALLLLLDSKGICASAGSACTAGSLEPSHVLLSIGRSPELAHSAIRLTLSADNTPEEIEVLLREIPAAVAHLRRMSPVWKELEEGRREYAL